MKYRLERYVNDDWYSYGIYDVSDKRELEAMIEAANMFGKLDLKVRVIKIDG